MSDKLIKHFDETRVLWRLNKITIFLVVVLFITNISLLTILHYLFPLKTIEPYFITIHPKSDQVIVIEPLAITKDSFEIIKEALSRKYVLIREQIDFQTESKRYQEVYWLSSEEIYNAFERLMNKDNKGSPLKHFYDRGIYRNINVIMSQNLGPLAPNVWQVEWEAIDIDEKTQKEVNKSTFVSTITAEIRSQNSRVDNQFINPIGFTVINYKVALKKKV